MDSRYTRLFSLSENLYAWGAPVVITAGALLRDNQSGKTLAQLKIRNIQDKAIKAVTVKVTPFDTVGKALGEVVEYQYLDLIAERDDDFGQKTPIIFKEASTRSFSAVVSEVIFSDNSAWTASDAAWESLPEPVTLEEAFNNEELVKQYKMKFGEFCLYTVQKEKDLWRCACGAINRADENCCHSCQRELAEFDALDMEELSEECYQRLEKEVQETAERKKKTKKYVRITAIVIVALILLGGIVKVIQTQVARANSYKSAVTLAEEGKYNDAVAAFKELGNYKDSEKQMTYNQALSLLEAKAYRSAKNAFESLGDYKDCKEQLENVEEKIEQESYDQALSFLQEKNYNAAKSLFESLGDYKDSKEQSEKLTEYLKADSLLSDDDYESAREIFSNLGDYADSAEKIEQIDNWKSRSKYIGEYVCTVDGKEMHLTSDFVERDGNVCWKMSIPEGDLIGMSHYANYFFFSGRSVNQLVVSQDMTVTDRWEQCREEPKPTLTASFRDGDIYITAEGYYVSTDDFYTRHYTKVK